jgi:hypothetical protein
MFISEGGGLKSMYLFTLWRLWSLVSQHPNVLFRRRFFMDVTVIPLKELGYEYVTGYVEFLLEYL